MQRFLSFLLLCHLILSVMTLSGLGPRDCPSAVLLLFGDVWESLIRALEGGQRQGPTSLEPCRATAPQRVDVSSGSVEEVEPRGQEGKGPVVQWCDFAAPVRVPLEAWQGGLLSPGGPALLRSTRLPWRPSLGACLLPAHFLCSSFTSAYAGTSPQSSLSSSSRPQTASPAPPWPREPR